MAYEDDRKILPTGLLSTASKPSYVPKQINVKVPKRTKPGPTHVNVDMDEFRQRMLQEQQANQQAGGKIICTEYYIMGYMSERIFFADQIYGARIAASNPRFMSWYLKHAPWWVRHVRKSKLFRAVLWWFVKPWSEQMAFETGYRHKGNLFGKLLMKIGHWMYKIW